jgi:hypothetical protein
MTEKTPLEPRHWRDRGPSDIELRPVTEPLFLSWTDYLARTSDVERMAWCAEKAKRANRRNRPPYLPTIPWLSRKSEDRERADIDWFQQKLEDMGLLPLTPDNLRLGVMLIRAEESQKAAAALAEPNPKLMVTKHQVWAILETARGRCAYCNSLAVERAPANPATRELAPWAQIGRRIGSLDHVNSAENHPDNLAWCCLWCNTWPQERRPSATDHGGYYPKG